MYVLRTSWYSLQSWLLSIPSQQEGKFLTYTVTCFQQTGNTPFCVPCGHRLTWDWSHITRDLGSWTDMARTAGIEAVILSVAVAAHPLFKVHV